jgi:DNA-binding response OmpR family regulator
MNRMLIVDDEPSICFAVGDYFTTEGYEVDCAQTLDEAAALIDAGCYSAVLADLRLSAIDRLDGIEVIKAARERCPHTRIIVMTAYGADEVEEEVYRLGADAFVQKPKPLKEVAEILSGLAERRA